MMSNIKTINEKHFSNFQKNRQREQKKEHNEREKTCKQTTRTYILATQLSSPEMDFEVLSIVEHALVCVGERT